MNRNMYINISILKCANDNYSFRTVTQCSKFSCQMYKPARVVNICTLRFRVKVAKIISMANEWKSFESVVAIFIYIYIFRADGMPMIERRVYLQFLLSSKHYAKFLKHVQCSFRRQRIVYFRVGQEYILYHGENGG